VLRRPDHFGNNIESLKYHIEDIAECLDEHTKALITINQRIELIMKKLSINIPEPLINMNFESGSLTKERIIDVNTTEEQENEQRKESLSIGFRN
jgi:hypothetical protein